MKEVRVPRAGPHANVYVSAATAINGRADALVTRDKDLLDDEHIAAELAKRGCAVMRVEGFLRSITAPEHGLPVDTATQQGAPNNH